MIRVSVALAGGLAGLGLLHARQAATDELSTYRTVATAIAAKVRPAAAGTGYLGAALQLDTLGRLVVEEVQPTSPADRAGMKKTDVVTHVGGQAIKSLDAYRKWLQAHAPGETVKLTLLRADQRVEVSATLAATSRPMKTSTQQAFLGITLGQASDVEGVRVERVTNNSPAAAAGVRAGDFLVKLEGNELSRPNRLTDVLYEKRPGDTLSFTVRRDGKDIDLRATLMADGGDGDGRRGGFRGRGEGRGKGGGADGAKTARGGFGGRGADGPPPNTIWPKNLMRLAVVGLEYPDQKRNAKVTARDWSDALFSRGSYDNKSNATGQPIHGSLCDYFAEQSHGAFRLEGKVFDWVELSKKRGEYSQGTGTSNKALPLIEALDKLTARDGNDALNGFDAIVFLYAGDMPRGGRGGPGGGGGGGRGPQVSRGSLYYPHAGTFVYQAKRFPYFFGPEGGETRMAPIGGFAKEFARLLGLPDLATHTPGSEGLGPWCALSDTFPTARPQHLSAWAKEKLGWLKPTVIDPTVKQKLILAPVEDSATECFKVLVRPDGSEYFLLENRARKGFDADLPGEGLLIWRVVNDRPVLEESHGVEGPAGPTVHLSAVPYPSAAANAFTPETTPSSRSPLGGGLPVHITDIRRLPDGRIAFHVGYEYR